MKKKLSLEIEEALYNELKRVAREKNMTLSTIIRNLIAEYLLEARATREG